MTRIGFQRLTEWCRENGYLIEDWLPRPSSDDLERIELAVPSDPLSVTELIDDLVVWPDQDGELVVWIRDWTIWNDRSQEIGLRHLDLLGRCANSEAAEPSAQVYLLSPGEWKEAIALLTIPVLYSWDAHLMFASGRREVDFSHEDRITIWFSGHDTQVTHRFTAWKFTAPLN